MEKAVEYLINRPLTTDWFSLCSTATHHALSSSLYLLLLFFLSILQIEFDHFQQKLTWYLYRETAAAARQQELICGCSTQRLCF